jgi:hypothetical protein
MTTSVKKQTAKVGVSGSLINQMMSNNSTLPEVGKGATELHYSDRTCYEVVEVSSDGKTAKLEYLEAQWDKSKEGGQGHQNWILKPTGSFITVTWRNNAWRKIIKQVVFTKEFTEELNSKGIMSGANYLKANNPELFEEIYQGDVFPQKIVDGYTKEKTTYDKIRILFGVKDYYYDWFF